ncbi:DUF4870 domain-containing protein [Ktedonobacteria bacterium brp13]|nr:DUF4870 domain-containing protein [Ktedonobacteria bacterium brp13]
MSYQDPYQQPGPQPTDPYNGAPQGNSEPYNQYGAPGTPPNPQQPYGQAGYQQQQSYGQQQAPYGQPQSPYGNPNPQTTALGMSPNVTAALSYVVGIIMGPVVFFLEKQNRFVRFHAVQSFILCTLTLVLWGVSNALGQFSLAFYCLSGLVVIAGFVGWLVSIINAGQGKFFKLPVIGDYAEKFVNQNPGDASKLTF